MLLLTYVIDREVKMSIEYAILGLLSWKPLSGYDLKKLISDSNIYYWSGNNNQIYKALLQMHQEGWVTQEVINQQTLPARKEYAITEKGQQILRQWLVSLPEPPELRSLFLIHLEWAHLLTDEELDKLLDGYINEVKLQLIMAQEKIRRETRIGRSARETFLWRKIAEKTVSIYQDEIEWVEHIRAALIDIRE
jgi:PadR family transcriptional regulator, regulatory protein AphA